MKNEGAPAMSWKSVLPVLAALVMTIPSLIVTQNVLAQQPQQDIVPIQPNAAWSNQVATRQYLYARYATITAPDNPATGTGSVSDNNRADCTGTATGISPFLGFFPATDQVAGTAPNPRQPCVYSADVAGVGGTTGGAATVAQFGLTNEGSDSSNTGLLHDFNVSGNTSLIWQHYGNIADGVTMTVQLKEEGTQVSVATYTAADCTGDQSRSLLTCIVPLLLTEPNSAHTFHKRNHLTITVTGSAENGGPLPVGTPGGAPQWTLTDTRTFLAIASTDGLKAATWTQDDQGTYQTLFRPLERNVTPPNGVPHIVGTFATQSAFSYNDARNWGGEGTSPFAVPVFAVEKGGRPIPMGPQGVTTLLGVINEATSQPAEGRAVWNFPSSYLDYRGLDAGEYNVTVSLKYRQGGEYKAGTIAKFLITTQAVSISPYDDTDPTTFPSPIESQSHEMAPGGETTYVLLVTNNGAVNDTFQVEATFISGQPSGWSASLGGPGVADGQVKLAPAESKVVTLTVFAPPGAPVNSNSIFVVSAKSLLDPTAKAQPMTVISTVSNNVVRQAGVIPPVNRVSVQPGATASVPVFVWNRGTRNANMSIEIRDATPQGWTVGIGQGDNTVSRFIFNNLRPGDIGTALLRVTAPVNAASGPHDVGLNVTNLDAGGISVDGVARFFLESNVGVRVTLLEPFPGLNHNVELSTAAGNPTCRGVTVGGGASSCVDDGVDGVWFRAFVTNTGTQADTFDLAMDSIKAANNTVSQSGCTFNAPNPETAFLPYPQDDSNAGVFFRNANGEPGVIHFVSLQAGETAEVYVWRHVARQSDPCPDHDRLIDFYDFALTAKGQTTGATGRAGGETVAEDTGGTRVQAYLDAVTRCKGTATPDAPCDGATYEGQRPLVDISDSLKRTIDAPVETGKNTTIFVRATNADSFATVGSKNADMKVTVTGIDREHGWNVSIRPVIPEFDINNPCGDQLHPCTDNITITNQHNNRREAWFDQEIAVTIQPPNGKNGTGLADSINQFLISANPVAGGTPSTLNIKAFVTRRANVTAVPDAERALAHAGQPTAFVLYVNNSGSINTTVTLTTALQPGAPNPNGWQITPSVQQFPVAAFKNQTLLVTVQPPVGAPVGSTGTINVTLSYPPDPTNLRFVKNSSLELVTEVAPRGTLQYSGTGTQVTIPPGGFANYTLSLKNTGSQPVSFTMSGTELPNWSQTLSPISGTLSGSEVRPVVYVLKAPPDVTDGARFASILRVSEVGNDANFDVLAVTANILGGSGIPQVSSPTLQKTVDRNGVQSFEVQVSNIGTKAENISLTVHSADPAWKAFVQDQQGNNISQVRIQPQQLMTVNVTVRAPFQASEHLVVPIELTADTGSQIAKLTLQAVVHDYGVHVELSPPRLEAIAGAPNELIVKLRNDGNDNDTLNVSAILQDIPDWTVDLAATQVRLEPGQTADIRATLRSPTSPLPTPRAYTIKFYAGTIGGVAVNLSKNETVAGLVNILNYRPIDVDHDDLLELAVDFDRDPSNGFERFVEPFSEGLQSVVVATGHINGRANFFLDVPRDRPYDGIADVWFDPETLDAFDIKFAPDINGDNTPDYLIDSDRDTKIDKAYDVTTGNYWNVVEIKAYGDERIQYLVDTTNDGRPDRFFDPESKVVTRTQSVNGDANLVGIDTKNNGKVDKVYDIKANAVSDAKVQGFVDFARQYWYFFIVFVALVVLTIVLVVRRRRRAPPAP